MKGLRQRYRNARVRQLLELCNQLTQQTDQRHLPGWVQLRGKQVQAARSEVLRTIQDILNKEIYPVSSKAELNGTCSLREIRKAIAQAQYLQDMIWGFDRMFCKTYRAPKPATTETR